MDESVIPVLSKYQEDHSNLKKFKLIRYIYIHISEMNLWYIWINHDNMFGHVKYRIIIHPTMAIIY